MAGKLGRIDILVHLVGGFAGGQPVHETDDVDRLPGFKRRKEWFIENRKDLRANVACLRTEGENERKLLSIVDADQLRSVLRVMLYESEFLSPLAARALTRPSG